MALWASPFPPRELGFVREKTALEFMGQCLLLRNKSFLSAFHMGQEKESGSLDDFRSLTVPWLTDLFPLWLKQTVSMWYIFLGPGQLWIFVIACHPELLKTVGTEGRSLQSIHREKETWLWLMAQPL